MKKLIILTITVLIVCLTGCSNNDEELEDEIFFCEGLPTYQPLVNYKRVEISDEQSSYYITDLYEETDGTYIFVYHLPIKNKSLEEVVESEIKTKYPNSKYDYVILDNWATDGDFHYGYYMAYQSIDEDSSFFIQNYFFIVDDEVVKLQFYEPAIRMHLPINGWTIDLPQGYIDGTLDKDELADDAIAKFVPGEVEEFPDINVYRWDKEYDSYEEFAEEELSELYEMDYYEIREYIDLYGNEQYVLFSVYDEDDEGELQTNFDVTIDIGDSFISFDFFVLEEDDYIRHAVPAIASTIAHK